MTQGIALVVDFAAERCFVLSGYRDGKNLVLSLPKSVLVNSTRISGLHKIKSKKICLYDNQ
jgi:hypothetical protein